MKRDKRVEFSRRAARRIEEGDEPFYAIDEEMVSALAAERAAVVAWLAERGYFYLSEDLKSRLDEVES